MKDEQALALLREASEAARHAHCPYSKYAVGAALLTAHGHVFRGCNVENASYGLTVCAERTAFYAAVAAGHRQFHALAVIAAGDALPDPCGACRQVMAEFCEPGFLIHVAAQRDPAHYETLSLAELLPKAFRL